MASIDWTVLGLGALVGIGCREQLKACGRVAATTAASLAATAAQAAAQVAAETQASEATLQRVNQHIDQQLAGSPLGGQPQAGQDPNNPNG